MPNGSVETGRRYVRRIVDAELHALLPALPALSIEGPKAVGKTETALQRAASVYRQLGDDFRDRLVVTTGPAAYRRPGGVGVVPAALLGP